MARSFNAPAPSLTFVTRLLSPSSPVVSCFVSFGSGLSATIHPSRLHRNKSFPLVELGRLALRPLIQSADVDHDLSLRIQRHLRAVHRPRRRSFEVDPFAVVTAA